MAGEDIVRDDIAKKSEENIIGLATDSKRKQKRLKFFIGVLLVVSALAVSIVAATAFRENIPQNFISPIDKNSIEMKTAEMLSGADGAFIYKYTATDEFKSLIIYISEYHSGELVSRENMEIGYEGIGSPRNGTILIVPDFNDFSVKLIIADDESKLSTEIPILENVPERQYYGRSATEISENTDIRYDEEQALLALIYDNDVMRTFGLYDLMNGQINFLAMNDYVYYFSFAFCKE